MKLGNKELQIPLIQGGMGVGVSLSRLAGAVALQGAMGVISSVNIGFPEPDFERNPLEANCRALRYHIRRAKEIAQGHGLIGVNIMTAVSHYDEMCRIAVEEGADVIISGAGLPLKLPAFTKDSQTLAAPIVASGKAARLLCQSYWKHYGVRPDFLVIEGHQAGGHLGFSPEDLENGTCRSNEEILKEVLEVLQELGCEIPVFVGGGIYTGEDWQRIKAMGGSGVQVGTRFIATQECDAADGFKQALLKAKPEDICIVKSPVGMPARAIRSPLLERLKSGERFPALTCNNCLPGCPKGEKAPYCISRALIQAVQGDWENGLFFCGENAWRLQEITTVPRLIGELMGEE